MAKEKYIPDIQVTELFMAKCGNDWSCTFVGTIHRYTNEDGSKLVVGKIPVHDNMIVARAKDDRDLGRRLDQLILLVLNFHINQLPSHIIELADLTFYLN